MNLDFTPESAPEIPADFPETGWHIQPGPVPPARVQVFGERSSGTNFVKRLLGRNTPLQPIEALGWKHGFPQMTAIPPDVLIVACVRDARPWSLSMHAKPWHTPPAMQRLGYSDFIRHPWETIADRKRYFPQVADLGGDGRPLQHDRNPLTGLPFPDLFSLRRAKLASLLSFMRRDCTLVVCRLEAVQQAPEAFLANVARRLALRPPGHYRPVVKRLGSRFRASVEARPETPRAVPEADLVFLRGRLHLETESRLGYDYG